MNIYDKYHYMLYRVFWYLIAQFNGVIATLVQLFTPQRKPTGLVNRNGHVAIVTGGTAGIGLHVTIQLLELGMTVFATSKDGNLQSKNITSLKKSYGERVQILHLELSSLKEIEKFAQEFLKTGQRLNLLVCNAGVMMCPYEHTEDRFEMQLGVNYLGHVYLCSLLLDKLKKSATPDNFSRIVLVSSCMHSVGTIQFDDINSSSIYSPEQAYAQSKLALVIYAIYLNQKLQQEGANVTVNAVHPGVVRSDLYKYTRWYHFADIAKYFLLPLEKGAHNVIHAAASKEVESMGGLYFENNQPVKPNPLALDKSVQEQLWKMTNNMLDKKI